MKKKNIVIGISSSIAIYKSLDLISSLHKDGYNINVVMTKNATKLVSPNVFWALSHNPVIVDLFKSDYDIPHIQLCNDADIFIICPATYNIIGKIANGIADDSLSTVAAAINCRKIIAPAMNVNMYNNPVLQENLTKLNHLGYEIIEPDKGILACGVEGKGKLRNIQDILEIIRIDKVSKLKDKRILITGGGTVEPIDAVRVITNRSSGKMGIEVAKEAIRRGAKVTFIHGNVSVDIPDYVNPIFAPTTELMYNRIREKFDNTDILIMAAAVSDFKVKDKHEEKIKKTDEVISLELITNIDILKECGRIKKHQILVGFAAETQDLIKNAKSKLINKNLDMIVANNIMDKDSGFDVDTNKATILLNDDSHIDLPLMTKSNLSIELLNLIESKYLG